MISDILFTEHEINKEYRIKDRLILTYTIKYPQFTSGKKDSFLRKINKYYYKKAMSFKKHFDRELYQEALDLYIIYEKQGSGISHINAMIDFKITYNDDGVLSLYFDQSEDAGSGSVTRTRYSDNWDMKACKKIPLSRFFKQKNIYSLNLVTRISEEVNKQSDTGELYFENSADLLRKMFDSDNYYLTDEAIVVFYQQYVIAPFASGIKEFFIRYDDELLDN